MNQIKKTLHLAFCMGIFLFPNTHFAQRLMAVSPNLLDEGSRYEATWKGAGSFPKFRYADYQVVSGKTGWTKTQSNSKLFSRMEQAKSERQGSYLFASSTGDSASVNFNRNADYRGLHSQGVTFFGEQGTLTIGNVNEVLESKDNLVAFIELNYDNLPWNLVISQTFGPQSETGNTFFGWLTDGSRRIDIKAVFDYQEPGKKSAIDIMLGGEFWHKGFEFFEDAASIGAVQLGPTKKQFVVWFSNHNDRETNFLLGSAYAAILKEYMITSEY